MLNDPNCPFQDPAGNGKTISIKALMHSLFSKSKDSIPSLYVKSAPRTYDIRSIFQQARYMAPCLLIFEDIDTIVTPGSRSYFLNEVDGLENNDGILMVASTNHLDRLDPGLSSRPSRFDRKYLFPLPSAEERVLYCEYWRTKLASKPSIKFPKKLCPAIAGITQDFSFAYLKEAFVATLLAVAGHRSEDEIKGGGDDEGGNLDDYELWREMKKQVKLLRDEMDTRSDADTQRSWNDGGPMGDESALDAWPSHQMRLPSRFHEGENGRFSRQLVPRFNRDSQGGHFVTDDGKFLDNGSREVNGLEIL